MQNPKEREILWKHTIPGSNWTSTLYKGSFATSSNESAWGKPSAATDPSSFHSTYKKDKTSSRKHRVGSQVIKLDQFQCSQWYILYPLKLHQFFLFQS